MALQAQQAELEQMYGGGSNKKKAKGIDALHGEAKKAKSFEELYKQYK
jgi:hypothetical protein